MSDILQAQDFVFQGLRSCSLFAAINIVLERKWQVATEIAFSTIWQSAAPGQTVSGAGLLVEMPKLEVPKPNSLQRNLVLSVGVIEERNINMSPAGTQVSAEQWAELALDFMAAWAMGLSSGLTPETAAVVPADDLIEGPGLIAYRARVSFRREHRAAARCDTPVFAAAGGGTYSWTNGSNTPGAAIYYTSAASPAGLGMPASANSAAEDGLAVAVLWNGSPVTLASGTYVNWCAWLPGYLPSHIGTAVIS